jgi:pimeloyl-ACP methyl ester carboxylesterase
LRFAANAISLWAMSTNFLQRGQGRIAYDVEGDGPLVICLPGMGDLRSVYRFTTSALVSAGFRVATMDLRGHGESDDGFDAYDDVALARDALALISHLGGEPAALIGNSMGAGAAVWAAAERPEAISGIGLIGPFVRNPEASRLSKLLVRLTLMKPWGPRAWAAYYSRFYPGQPPADLADHQARILRSLKIGDHWRSFVQTTRTDHTPAETRLDRVTSPAIVVMGERDPDWPDPSAEAQFVANRLRAELVLVPDAGHYPMAETPELVNPALEAFLRRTFAHA